MQLLNILSLAALAAAVPMELVERQSPDKSQIYIISTSTSGNGCPQGSVTTTLSPDKEVVTFGFDSFQTYIGPGTTVQDRTKNCQLHLNVHCKFGGPSVVNPVADPKP